MTNFILKHRQTTEPDIKKMTAILNAHGVKLLDGSLLPKTALVEIEESCLEGLQTDLGTDWNVYPEKKYRVPETNKKNKKNSL
jgi:hypothetical protein